MRENKIALITGGSGYIGANLVEELLNKGLSVIVVDNLSTGYYRIKNKNSFFYNIDILQKRELEAVFANYEFDVVFHLAAKLLVEESMSKVFEYYEINFLGTKNILELMLKYNVKNLIFSSTAAVYDNLNQNCQETSSTVPNNCYGATKLAAENLIKWTVNAHENLKAVSLRYFNVAGASEKYGDNTKTHLIPVINEAIIQQNTVKIYGNDYDTKDKTCVRDYVHVLDLVNAHYQAFHHLENSKIKYDVFNLGTNRHHTNKEIVECAIKNIGHVKYRYEARRSGDPTYLVANATKAFEILGWKNKYTIKNIILSDYEWRKKRTIVNKMD